MLTNISACQVRRERFNSGVDEERRNLNQILWGGNLIWVPLPASGSRRNIKKRVYEAIAEGSVYGWPGIVHLNPGKSPSSKLTPPPHKAHSRLVCPSVNYFHSYIRLVYHLLDTFPHSYYTSPSVNYFHSHRRLLRLDYHLLDTFPHNCYFSHLWTIFPTVG